MSDDITPEFIQIANLAAVGTALASAQKRIRQLEEEIRRLLVLAPCPDEDCEEATTIAFRYHRFSLTKPQEYPLIRAILGQKNE